MQSVQPIMVLFVTILVMGLIWIPLISMFFRRLETNHPSRFEEMGRPSLLAVQKHLPGTLAALKFVFTRQHKALDDPWLSRLSDFMLFFVSLYLLLFVVVMLLPQQAAT